MLVLHFMIPIQSITMFPFNLLGIILIIFGILISIIGSRKFEQEDTTSMTFDTPTKLVVDGIYKLSRNPMYLGFTLFIAGFWLIMGSLSSLFIAISFIVVLDRYYIPFEEKVLLSQFGNAYLEYKKSVRRWV